MRMRSFIVGVVAMTAFVFSQVGVAHAYTTKPAQGKALMCYQYQPGSWTTVYVPDQQIDNRLAKGDYLFGACLPA